MSGARSPSPCPFISCDPGDLMAALVRPRRGAAREVPEAGPRDCSSSSAARHWRGPLPPAAHWRVSGSQRDFGFPRRAPSAGGRGRQGARVARLRGAVRECCCEGERVPRGERRAEGSPRLPRPAESLSRREASRATTKGKGQGEERDGPRRAGTGQEKAGSARPRGSSMSRAAAAQRPRGCRTVASRRAARARPTCSRRSWRRSSHPTSCPPGCSWSPPRWCTSPAPP